MIDPNHQAVQGATVTISTSRSSTRYSGSTNRSGELLETLAPGAYSLTVRQAGFTLYSRSIAMRSRDQEVVVPLALEKETTSITVSEQAAQLDTATDSHQDSLKLQTADLSNLPVRDGDVISALSFFTNAPGGSPTIIIDGMERTDSIPLSPTQIDEVRLNNNAYSAEYPKPGRNRIEIDTKGGSEDFHTDFALRVRNAVFDARNPFAATRPPFSRNDYELNLSGPVLHKKLYYFLSASRQNQQQIQPILAYLPGGPLNQEVVAPFGRNLALGRLDWQQSEKHRLSAKYELLEEHGSNIGVGGFVLADAGSNQFHRDYRIELSDQYVLSPNAINNFRLALGANFEQMTPQTTAPSIVVPGAFQAGGSQLDHYRKEDRYELQDRFSYVKGIFTLKAGAEANLHPFTTFSKDDFGGVYQFASLAAYTASQPILYTINSGNPLIVSGQDDYAWYVQSEVHFSRVTLFAGLRHEFQSHLSRYDALAPRIAAAWSLDRRSQTILRAGAGVFYDRRPPVVLQQVERFNGLNTLQTIIENPVFASLDSSANPVATTSLYQFDGALTLPRVYQVSTTLERRLPAGLLATADFTFERGTHLFRTRNINAPLPVTYIRPDPLLGNVDQIESSASSRGTILNITLKTPPAKRYQLFAQYSLSHLMDDTNNSFGPPPPGGLLPPGTSAGNLFSLPADNYDLRPEWGPSNNDMRHQLGLTATVHLPWRLNFGSLTAVHSGLPYDITTGQDNNRDIDANDRPAGVTRNTGRGAGFFSMDLHLSRPFSIEQWRHSVSAEAGLDAFNVLNHTNPSSYVGVVSSPLFGLPNAAYNGRELQLSLQLHF